MAGLFGTTRQQYVDSLKKRREAEEKAAKSKSLVGGRAASNLASTIAQIKLTTQKYLSKYISQYLLLTNEEEIVQYFDDIIASGFASIDTETTGLDTLTCDLVGLCLYVPGKKPCYIPTGHVGHVTKMQLAGQVSKEFLKTQLERCSNVKWVFHNAKFDIRVLRHTVGVRLKPYWDTMIAARLLNENESAALKNLHLKYCDSQDEKALTISTLFDGLNFALIPIECAYLYAAGDAIKTWDLYEFQKLHLDTEALKDIRYVFDNVEMPLIEVLADMEDTGIYVDQKFASELQVKYHKLLQDAENACYECINKYKDQIDLYKRLTPGHKLSDPITLGSSTQIAILLYDIFKLQPKVKSRTGSSRGTGEEILRSLDHEFPELLLKYREMSKLITTYVDKLPSVVNEKTGRIHPTFKQIGADTGRLASSDPNLQNIPSHNKEIRKMFAASEGCYFVSGDYSLHTCWL